MMRPLCLGLMLLAAFSSRAPAQDAALPRTALTDFEKVGMLPDWLAPDYDADMAAAADPLPVVARYRAILQAVNGLSDARKKELAAKGAKAGTRAERDELVARYAGIQSPVPVKTIRLGNDSADVGLTFPKWHPTPDVSLGYSLKGGLLAPMGATGDQNSTLRSSPYVQAAVTGAYDGAVKAMLTVTGSVALLQSAKAFNDPTGASASNAGDLRTQKNFSQTFAMGSAYTDVGTVASFGPSLRAAFWAAGDALLFSPTAPGSDDGNPATPIISVGAGTMWMVKQAQNEVTAFTDVRLQGVSANTRLYGDYTVSPSLTTGVEYARIPSADKRLAIGAEGTISPGDAALRPYVTAKTGDFNGTVAGDFRASRSDFYPTVAGGGAQVGWQATPILNVGVKGSVAQETYSLAPAPELDYTGMVTLDFNLARKVQVKTALRAPERYDERNVVADSAEMNRHVANGIYDKNFLQALKDSPTMPEFAKAIGARDLDSILSALSALSFNLNKWNYDHNTSGWSGTDAELYTNARNSILNGKANPDLECVGAATFIAGVAVELGRQAGVAIQAAAVGVEVPSNNGTLDNHFVAAVKTQAYGIVFVDWGQMTPTYTFNTRKALDIFQGLQGVPSVAHYIADTSGRFGGYMFSADGKVMVENMTFHSELPSSPVHQIFRDDPETTSITTSRYKEMLEKQ